MLTQVSLGVLAVLALSGAAAQGVQAAADTAKDKSTATVYFYRYKQFTGRALEPSIYCDEREAARMDNGRYFAVKVDPGTHTFRSNDKQSGIKLDLKAGELYYVRVELATGFWKGHGRLVLVQKEQGVFEIGKLAPLGPDKIRDNDRVVTVPPQSTN